MENMARLKNFKHEHFSREYVNNNGNASQAYKEAYPACQNDSAVKSGSRLLNNAGVKKRITELLDTKEGSKLHVLLEDLISLKNAQKPIIVDKVVKYVKDNGISLESTKTLLKLHGLLSANSNSVTDARSVTFNVTAPDIQSLDKIASRLQRMRERTDYISGRVD